MADDIVEIPDNVVAIFACSCGARAWLTEGHDEDDRQWFDDLDYAHADCDEPRSEHTEVDRPAFGYVADDRDYFLRAMKAKDLAEHARDFGARFLANAVLDADPDDYDRLMYRRDVAALAYAQAVYDEQAAKVRAA